MVLANFANLFKIKYMKKLSIYLLNKYGWKIHNQFALPDKCVICFAPHTSNWDFFWGNLLRLACGVQAHFLIKKEWFFFPVGSMMRRIGGIPVDRSKKTSLTDTMTQLFAVNDKFRLTITPEGTRQKVLEWKKGFYIIACKAKVPIVLAFIDYKTKELGFGKIFYPAGDIENDLPNIQAFYSAKTGKFPDRFHV
jgi:1-acyl-sn-glycerol-3-phosphate acyltransferase